MNRRGVIGSLLGLVGFGGSAVAKEDKQGDEFKIKVCDVYGREFKKSELDNYIIFSKGSWNDDPADGLCRHGYVSGFRQVYESVCFVSPVDGKQYHSYLISCMYNSPNTGRDVLYENFSSVIVPHPDVFASESGVSYDCSFPGEDEIYFMLPANCSVVESKGYDSIGVVTRSDGEKYRKYVVKDSGVRS